ncbi:MAG: sulfotransferase [Candidatus Thiodiazotropha sp. (ex Dulcina madagascariensis)]|nr:sulfotransferase [Candidatus Thiodiazotropha sp. (ex Dulcina madagascariensis)]
MKSNKLNTPNIIIAGVTKSATTSLFSYLSDHPKICGSSIKEISHFITIRFNEPDRPIENYSNYYKHCSGEPYRIEASPAYFLGGKKLAEKIYKTLPGVRVILMLRDPASRFLSYYKFNKNILAIPKDMKLCEYYNKCKNMSYESFKQRGTHIYYALASGEYSNYLNGWIDTFGENLYICFFEDLTNDTYEFTKHVCDWLEIDKNFYNQYDFVIENMGRNYKNRILQKWALKINKNFEEFFRSHKQVKRLLRQIYFGINGERGSGAFEEVDIETISEIRKHYSLYNADLRKVLLNAGVNRLPSWLC